MAIIKCPQCDMNISTRAFSCPHCDFKLKNKREIEYHGVYDSVSRVMINEFSSSGHDFEFELCLASETRVIRLLFIDKYEGKTDIFDCTDSYNEFKPYDLYEETDGYTIHPKNKTSNKNGPFEFLSNLMSSPEDDITLLKPVNIEDGTNIIIKMTTNASNPIQIYYENFDFNGLKPGEVRPFKVAFIKPYQFVDMLSKIDEKIQIIESIKKESNGNNEL